MHVQEAYCSILTESLFKEICSEFRLTEEDLLDMRLDSLRVILEDLVDSKERIAMRSTEDYDIWNYDRVVRMYSEFMEEYNKLL